MAFLTIDEVNPAVRPPAAVSGWLRRLCEIYKIAQTRKAERELRRFHHLHAIPWAAEDDRLGPRRD